MALGVDDTTVEPLNWTSLVLLLGALVLSFVVVTMLSEDQRLVAPLRKRFVLGVPWGTLIVIVGLYAFYHLVQGGGEPGGPNIVGFRSWSIWYPQGILLSAFSHANDSHLIGNLLGTLAFAPIVEYAMSHYPTERGSQSFSSWRTNPFARIGLFVVGTVLVGTASGLFVPGAVIGFSVVVFAFAGFALVVRPLVTVLALVGIQAVSLLRQAVLNPLAVAEAQRQFVTPSWAQTALQGHLFGMVVGVLLAVVFFCYRKESPNLRYVWFAALVFAVSRSMYAIYWYLGEDQFVLFRGVGTAGVFLLASLVALAVYTRDRSLVPGTVDVPVRTVAVGLLLAVVCAIALAGIPYNVVPVTPAEEAQEGINVNDYTVTYAENVEDKYVAIDAPVVKEMVTVEVSGVIVINDDRNIWAIDTPKEELAFEGRSVVVVGETTWREVVIVNRTQWETTGGNTTYKVFGRQWQVDDEQTLLYESESATVEPTINGSRIKLLPGNEFYDILVKRNETAVGRVQIPPHNESVEIGNIRFKREGKELFAIHERTEIKIAEYRIKREE